MWTYLSNDSLTSDLYINSFYSWFGFSSKLNLIVLELLSPLLGDITFRNSLYFIHNGVWRSLNLFLMLLTWLSSMIPDWISRKNSNFLPQKLPVSYEFLQFAAYYLSVNGIIGWCPMYLLLRTFDSANSLL